ncbi:diuretic hormone class 2 isoform X2 [Centruroides vittatus]
MSRNCIALALCLVLILATMTPLTSTAAVRQSARSRRALVEVDEPEKTLQVLGDLAERILHAEEMESLTSNEKRGLDLGLSRGFSGSQAAKHLMGLAAASFANGPGRRRREVSGQN